MDLFSSSTAVWRMNPPLAIASWINELSLSKESAKIYQFMMGKLFRWMESRQIDLFQMSGHDLVDFLDENNIHKGQRRRYARLVERLFDDFAAHGFPGDNPGRMAVFMGETSEKNSLTTFLSKEDKNQLIQYLSDIHPNGSISDEELRNAGILAMALGFGARAREVTAIRAGALEVKWGMVSCGVAVRMPDGRMPRVMKFAWEVLAACARGKREDDLLCGDKLPPDDATIYRRVRSGLQSAGITMNQRACLQTLRNTYLAMLIEEGECDEAIMAFAGIHTLRGLNLLKQAYQLST